MLPKHLRLRAEKVREVIKTGRSARAEGLSAKYTKAVVPKVAVIVSKKVAPGAVERNALRRRVYQNLPSPLPQVHVVFFVQSPQFDSAQVAHLCSQLS